MVTTTVLFYTQGTESCHRRHCLSKLQQETLLKTQPRGKALAAGRDPQASPGQPGFAARPPSQLFLLLEPWKGTTSVSQWAPGGGWGHMCPCVPAAVASPLKGSGERLSFTAVRTPGKHA